MQCFNLIKGFLKKDYS